MTMNYTKPEVAVLGQAVSVIEGVGKPGGSFDGGDTLLITSVYDLDE
jgi:hypothetical protein